MKAMKDQVVEQFRAHSSVDSEFLDSLNIARTDNAVDRDELYITR